MIIFLFWFICRRYILMLLIFSVIFLFIIVPIFLFIFVCLGSFSGFHFILFFLFTMITSEAFITFTYVRLDTLSVLAGRFTMRGTSVFSSLHHPVAIFTVIDC